MVHVIRESTRHRIWSGGKSKLRRNEKDQNFDELPAYESMRKGRRVAERALRSTPISRFFDLQIGRSWNKVWSNICRHADSRNNRARFFRKCAENLIAAVPNTFNNRVLNESNGKVYDRDYELLHGTIYVNENGIISKYNIDECTKSYRKQFNFEWGVIWPRKAFESGTQYRLIDGNWFSVTLKKAIWTMEIKTWHDWLWNDGNYKKVERAKVVYPSYYDVVTCEWQTQPHQNKMLYYYHNLYAINKRQLNTNEIKRLKLKEKFAEQRALIKSRR